MNFVNNFNDFQKELKKQDLFLQKESLTWCNKIFHTCGAPNGKIPNFGRRCTDEKQFSPGWKGKIYSRNPIKEEDFNKIFDFLKNNLIYKYSNYKEINNNIYIDFVIFAEDFKQLLFDDFLKAIKKQTDFEKKDFKALSAKLFFIIKFIDKKNLMDNKEFNNFLTFIIENNKLDLLFDKNEEEKSKFLEFYFDNTISVQNIYKNKIKI